MPEKSLDKVFDYINKHVNEHLAKMQSFLQQPSVSAENLGIRQCAELLKGYFEDLGCKRTQLVETDGNPIVYGEYDAGAEKTLIVYLMYDTQPVNSEKWTVPPFEAKLVEIKPFGKCIVARGAINSKGPLMAFLNALESIISVVGELPTNLILTAEGEEEMGSPHLPDFVYRYKDKLEKADAVFSPMAWQEKKGNIRMYLGYKGLIYFELKCSGRYWGKGPTQFDIHSGNKSWVDSPVWRLVHALESMTSEDGNKVLIDGFYEDVVEPSKEDLDLIEKLVKTFDEGPTKDMLKVEKFIDDAHSKEAIMKYVYSPTLNIDGIWGGYTGSGTKTVLPYEVDCKMDVRIVPNQDPKKILQKIRGYLDSHGYEDIKLDSRSAYGWTKTGIRENIVEAVFRAYKQLGYEALEIWPMGGGSVPIYLYTSGPLYLPYCSGGLGHGGRMHAPDEYFVVEGNNKIAGLSGCEKSYVAILYEFSRVQ